MPSLSASRYQSYSTSRPRRYGPNPCDLASRHVEYLGSSEAASGPGPSTAGVVVVGAVVGGAAVVTGRALVTGAAVVAGTVGAAAGTVDAGRAETVVGDGTVAAVVTGAGTVVAGRAVVGVGPASVAAAARPLTVSTVRAGTAIFAHNGTARRPDRVTGPLGAGGTTYNGRTGATYGSTGGDGVLGGYGDGEADGDVDADGAAGVDRAGAGDADGEVQGRVPSAAGRTVRTCGRQSAPSQ